MKKICLVLVTTFVLLNSCSINDDDSLLTKVGFYYKDSKASNEEVKTLNLFVDNEFKGKIGVFKEVPEERFLHFENLDSKTHQIDVKDDKGNYLTASYLYFKENSSGIGGGENANKVNGPCGFSVDLSADKNYYIAASFKNF